MPSSTSTETEYLNKWANIHDFLRTKVTPFEMKAQVLLRKVFSSGQIKDPHGKGVQRRVLSSVAFCNYFFACILVVCEMGTMIGPVRVLRGRVALDVPCSRCERTAAGTRPCRDARREEDPSGSGGCAEFG